MENKNLKNADLSMGFEVGKFEKKQFQVLGHFDTYEEARKFCDEHPRTILRFWTKASAAFKI